MNCQIRKAFLLLLNPFRAFHGETIYFISMSGNELSCTTGNSVVTFFFGYVRLHMKVQMMASMKDYWYGKHNTLLQRV